MYLRKFALPFMLVLFVLALPLAAQDSQPLTIGFAQVGTESDWRISFTDATIAEAESRGINLLYVDGQNSQDVQIEALRSFIDQGVDAIILAPVVETGWDTVLQEVHDAGIPLIIVDRNVTTDPSLYVTRVSSDFVHEGRLAAAWLAGKTAGDCNIVELQGTVGSSAARDRQIGFNEVIALFPNMRVVISQTGDFQQDEGKRVMENILRSEDMSQICAIWAHNDNMALGAVEAMKEFGIDPGDDVYIVSVDAITDIFPALTDGDTNASVELSPYMAAPAFDAIEAYLSGQEVPTWIPVQGNIYTPDNAAEEYARRTQTS